MIRPLSNNTMIGNRFFFDTDFRCEDEGFYPHPKDCKKYYWCLDGGASGLGLVAHQFTCPSGLYFNPSADSCDYTRNVLCNKKATTTTTTSTTTEAPTSTTSRYVNFCFVY